MILNNGMNNQQQFQIQNDYGFVNPMNNGTIDVVVTIDNDQQVLNYPVGPGITVMFVDFKRKIFYLKTTDPRGMQLPLATYTFSEAKQSQPEQYQNPQPINNVSEPQVNYVNYQEFDGLKKSVGDLNNSIAEMYRMLEDLTAPGK